MTGGPVPDSRPGAPLRAHAAPLGARRPTRPGATHRPRDASTVSRAKHPCPASGSMAPRGALTSRYPKGRNLGRSTLPQIPTKKGAA